MNLEQFNQLPLEAAVQELQACLGCEAWAKAVAQNRPVQSLADLIDIGAAHWQQASEDEILEAFSAHPKIGDLDALRNKYANTASAEQGQITQASEETLLALKANNEAYFDKFGFIFIVCATGKAPDEMLRLLNLRLPNDREMELNNGANEQWQITLLRLNKLFSEELDS